MKKSFLLFIMIISVAGNSHATPFLSLTDGSTTVGISDQGTGDSNPFAGSITYVGAIGGSWTSITTGSTKPFVGTSFLPELYIQSFEVNSSSNSNLELRFTETDFFYSEGLKGLKTDINAAALGGEISYQVYVGLDNDTDIDADDHLLFDMNVDTMDKYWDAGPLDGLGLDVGDQFSLTMIATVIHEKEAKTSFDATVNPVPEPATMLLLGIGLIGFAGVSRKKIFKKK